MNGAGNGVQSPIRYRKSAFCNVGVGMPSSTLPEVAAAVVRQAQRQGYVVPKDIRTALRLAELSEEDWKRVANIAKDRLHYRQGRYYPLTAVSPRLQREKEQQQRIEKIIRKLLKAHRAASKRQERRGTPRVDFIQPVTVSTEDGKEFKLLSRDLSNTGIRLLGTKGLLGQKVQIALPLGESQLQCKMTVRILWTCAVADDLFENGGVFVEAAE